MRGMSVFQQSKRLLGCGLILPAFLLSGCQTVSQSDQQSLVSPSQNFQQGAVSTHPRIYTPLSGLDGEAVSELLAAEIAGQRNQVDLALQLYLEQSARLSNPELARRATYIAQYAGDNQATLDAAAIWSDSDPDNVESRRISSTILIQQGDFLEAFEYQKELLAMGEETHFSYLAAQSIQSDDYTRDELLLALNELRAAQPDKPDLLTASAQLLYFGNQLTDAQEAVEASLSIAPLNVRSILLKADLAISQDGPSAGVAVLKTAVKQQPDNLRLQLALARTLVKEGDIDQAQTVFAQMASSHPENGQLTLSLALILMENGLTQQAEQELQKLIAQGQEKDTAHYYLGRLEEQEGNIDLAIEHYQAVKGSKDFIQSHARAAKLLIEQGDVLSARTHLATMRLTLPEYRVRLFLIESELLQSLGQTDEAYQLLSDAIQSEGSDYELLYSRAMLSLLQGDIASMEQDLQEILDSEPNNAMVLNTLGYTLTEFSDRYSEALLLIRKAAALKPGDPAIIDSLGWVYFKLGQFNESLLFLRQAYEQLQDPEVAAHLAEVYWVSNQKEEARALLLEARQLFPDHKLLNQLEQRYPALKIKADSDDSGNGDNSDNRNVDTQ